jgi:hypothetical protein
MELRDRLLFFGKGTSLHNGNALVARLIGSAIDTKNVTFWENSPALHMIIENGDIKGLTGGGENSGSPRRIEARKDVIPREYRRLRLRDQRRFCSGLLRLRSGTSQVCSPC